MPKPLVKVAGKRAARSCARPAGSEAGVERAVVNVHHFAEQMIAHLAARTRPQIVISDERGLLLGTGGGVVKALPRTGRRAVLPSQRRHHLDRRREAQSDAAGGGLRSRQAMDALLLLAPTAGSIGYAGRGDFAIGRRRPLARAARARGGALRLCRRRDSVARAVCRRAAGRIFAHHAVRPRRRGRAAAPACGWRACGCMSARPRPSPPRKPRSRRARGSSICCAARPVSRAMITVPCPAAKPNVFNIPASAPFLPVLIDALRAGKLVPGFPASQDPLELARATLYLPTRRACRLAREVFLDTHRRRRRHPAAHRRHRRPRRGRDRLRGSRHRRTGRSRAGIAGGDRAAGTPAAAGRTDPEMGEFAGGARRARRAADRQYAVGGAGPGRRSRPPDGRHDHAAGELGQARRPGAGRSRSLLAALAAFPQDRARDLAGAAAGTGRNRSGRAPRPADRGRGQTPGQQRRAGDRRRLHRLDAGDRQAARHHRASCRMARWCCPASTWISTTRRGSSSPATTTTRPTTARRPPATRNSPCRRCSARIGIARNDVVALAAPGAARPRNAGVGSLAAGRHHRTLAGAPQHKRFRRRRRQRARLAQP